MKLFSEFTEMLIVSVTSMIRASTTTGEEMDVKMYIIIFTNTFICRIFMITHPLFYFVEPERNTQLIIYTYRL